MGFKDHRDLASFMAARGFVWSNEQGNYVARKNQPESRQEAACELVPEINEQPVFNYDNNNLEKYIPLFEILFKHKEKLLNLLLTGTSPGTIPRYTIPGVTRTKSFYMSDALSKLISEFSQKNNVSQKEIIEAAVIEFLKAHSFGREVDAMLGGTLH